ncbi:hypothetical protein [Psittacicella hinzii]|uniref:Uncharacterized protein n=1 Tax=Psittacicella hinzii TaxID=2028575 RepID=A0A3A1YEY2_9GAMM|nr:hypothetical protein [Psittacicella hinzii]RIY35996.1 hypothetical protein CKF58_06315 [Psittacicella hinzii]
MAVTTVQDKRGSTYYLANGSKLSIQKELTSGYQLDKVNYSTFTLTLKTGVTSEFPLGSVIKVENANADLNGYWVINQVANGGKELVVANTKQRDEFTRENATEDRFTKATVKFVVFTDTHDSLKEFSTPDITYETVDVTATVDASPQTVQGQVTFGEITLTGYNAPDKEQNIALERARRAKEPFVLRHAVGDIVEYYVGKVTKKAGTKVGNDASVLDLEYTIAVDDADIILTNTRV